MMINVLPRVHVTGVHVDACLTAGNIFSVTAHVARFHQGATVMIVSSSQRHRQNVSATQRRHIHYGKDNPAAARAMEHHRQDIDQIAARVRNFYERKEKFRIFHGSTNSTRRAALGRDPKKVVDTSSLNRVLHVDVERQTALVEPNVPMDRLVEATIKHDLVPPVVMEFPGITAGGGYSGTSGESSSFKHGFFNRTLRSAEMVLANGEIVSCSDSVNSDLFHGAAGSLGTLGVTTLVEIELRKAEKYVETTYHLVSSVSEAIEKIQSLSHPAADLDYVDGILFSQDQGAIITGRLTSTIPSTNPRIQRFSSPRDPWFYHHVQQLIMHSPSSPTVEYLPLPEYLFRYDRCGFWVGLAAFQYFHFPCNRFTRWFLDDFLHTRMLYKALHGSGEAERMIVQDLALPYPTAESFIDFTTHRTGIWPLWLCPLKQSPPPTMHPHVAQFETLSDGSRELQPMLNIGLWGRGPSNREAFVQMNRDIEAKLKELRGMRWLYAQTYHSEDEFWQDFDQEWYEDLRRKYSAETLPTVYEKVKVDLDVGTTGREEEWWRKYWPLAGIRGLWKAIQSRDYVDARKSAWKEWVPR